VLKAEARIKEVKAPSDVKEILNYIAAMNHGLKRLDEFPLSLRLIKEIHAILLKDARGMERMPGEFRASQNWIGGTTINNAAFVPAPPQELSKLLDNFEKFLHDKQPMPSLIKVGILHSQFENIHPFLDGNGRIGRLLITFYLCQQKELSRPLLYLSAFFKKHRQEYYNRLHAVHESDDIEGWLQFFLEGVIETSGEAIETARKILKLREENTRKVAELGRVSKHALVVFEHLFRDPIITLKHVMEWTGLSKSNAYNLLRKLNIAGLLKFAGKTALREKVYYYQKYYHLFD
jgi:Fic family protein